MATSHGLGNGEIGLMAPAFEHEQARVAQAICR